MVDAVVDTFYNGFLTLPSSVAAELGLPYRGHSEAILADSIVEEFDIYGVTVS